MILFYQSLRPYTNLRYTLTNDMNNAMQMIGHDYIFIQFNTIQYYDGFSPGFGFLGIAVALLGRNHPFGVLCAAILFGGLMQGGLRVDMLTERVSKDIVYVVQGIIIVAVASAGALAHKPGRMKVREAENGD